MLKIINWLEKIEHLASELYLKASDLVLDDKDLYDFLQHTARDEAWHYHIMGSAANYVQKHSVFEALVTIDDEIKEKIESPFKRNLNDIENGKLDIEKLFECIIETEFSEWNDFFLYVINALKGEAHEFSYAAAEIQHHIDHIQHYIEKDSDRSNILEKIKVLPSIYSQKILIVEDDPGISTLLKALLQKVGDVHIAMNGKDGLKELNNHFFKLIVSDVDMPILDGISFFEQAIEKYPKIKNSFLFLTGDLTQDRIDFFEKNKIRYLQKPSSVRDIQKESTKIIYQLKNIH
jgi:two-component system, chemotaxis family, chemotaxis protein CheY